MSVYLYMGVLVEVGGQLVGVSSLLIPFEFQGLNTRHQVFWQAPLSAEPSHWP